MVLVRNFNKTHLLIKGVMNDYITSGLGLRSSRVSSNRLMSDEVEREQLISSLDKRQLNESNKSQGRPWKAKREDYDYGDHLLAINANENIGPTSLQQRRDATQPPGTLFPYMFSPCLFTCTLLFY